MRTRSVLRALPALLGAALLLSARVSARRRRLSL